MYRVIIASFIPSRTFYTVYIYNFYIHAYILIHSWIHIHHLWNMVEQCDGMSMHGFQWHWVTGVYWWRDRRQKQPEEFWSVQGYTVCPDSAKRSKVNWTVLHRTNGQWPKTYSKSNPGVFEGKKVEYFAMAKSISWFQPNWACISLAEDKTKGRKTHKQTTTEVSCSKGQAKHHKGGKTISGDVHEFQT